MARKKIRVCTKFITELFTYGQGVILKSAQKQLSTPVEREVVMQEGINYERRN
jgi:hypothetical protein